MADKGSQGMGKTGKNYGGESSKGTFPGPKPGSVMPKDKKHVSAMIGEKISKKVTSILKNDKIQSPVKVGSIAMETIHKIFRKPLKKINPSWNLQLHKLQLPKPSHSTDIKLRTLLPKTEPF
nr:hypothetical protein Iba_scaffold39448CG0020 [Ipomoea batatas]GMD19544.1 hypothetical protein Iba_chr07eCG9240 [Ipomoea batatas]GMD42539.1 hypothetical protein Iba_scaffold45572CG0010 [Ipomoea batatas]